MNILAKIREKSPLIHCLTNYVTVNDVANVLLAYGANPIMADDMEEVEEITTLCNGLYLNIGTLNDRVIQSMMLAAKTAKELGHPIILDPVGAGASKKRTETAKKILTEYPIAVVRGNLSEIKALVDTNHTTSGVDANLSDRIEKDTLEEVLRFAENFAKEFKTTVAITGAMDIVTDGQISYVIQNGKKEMSRITGTGCQLSAMVAAAVAANPSHVVQAAMTSVCAMGIAGEMAWESQNPSFGNATYRNRIIDVIYQMTEEIWLKGARYDVR